MVEERVGRATAAVVRGHARGGTGPRCRPGSPHGSSAAACATSSSDCRPGTSTSSSRIALRPSRAGLQTALASPSTLHRTSSAPGAWSPAICTSTSPRCGPRRLEARAVPVGRARWRLICWRAMSPSMPWRARWRAAIRSTRWGAPPICAPAGCGSAHAPRPGDDPLRVVRVSRMARALEMTPEEDRRRRRRAAPGPRRRERRAGARRALRRARLRRAPDVFRDLAVAGALRHSSRRSTGCAASSRTHTTTWTSSGTPSKRWPTSAVWSSSSGGVRCLTPPGRRRPARRRADRAGGVGRAAARHRQAGGSRRHRGRPRHLLAPRRDRQRRWPSTSPPACVSAAASPHYLGTLVRQHLRLGFLVARAAADAPGARALPTRRESLGRSSRSSCRCATDWRRVARRRRWSRSRGTTGWPGGVDPREQGADSKLLSGDDVMALLGSRTGARGRPGARGARGGDRRRRGHDAGRGTGLPAGVVGRAEDREGGPGSARAGRCPSCPRSRRSVAGCWRACRASCAGGRRERPDRQRAERGGAPRAARRSPRPRPATARQVPDRGRRQGGRGRRAQTGRLRGAARADVVSVDARRTGPGVADVPCA